MQADVLILCSIHSAGRSRFNETAIIGHSIIEPEAAGEVIAVKAVSGQDTTGNIAAQTALTDDVDRLTLVQLTQPLPQLVHRDVKEAVNVSVCEFFHSAGIQQSYASVTRKTICIFQMPLFQNTVCDIFNHKASHIYRVFRRGILEDDLSPSVPRPKIYVDENIPETWTPEEVRQLLAVIDRSNAIGKRDYAMLLLAVLLGMRAGDICALKFKNLDWRQKLITYTQQKTKKTNTLPLLPIIGDAIIDYLKNGRLDSDCDNVFIRHIHPYGEFQSSTSLSENLKRYMKYAGLTVKKRKTAHSLRHTLASTLLYDGTPLMTISNILGHNCPKTTSVYTKVDLPALRKCALSYGERRELK